MGKLTCKPKQKVLNAVVAELEKALKKEHIKIIFEEDLAQILFLPVKMVPNSVTEIRYELEDNGYLLFYSNILEGKGKQEVLSFNLIKIK